MDKLNVATRLLGAFLILFIAIPGAASADPTIAEVENLGDTLVFHPVTEFAELILTVTGPCDFQYKQRVTQGEPFFRLDETTIDGRYTYNLVRHETVDPDIVKVLLEARQAFDEETPKQLCRDGKLPAAPIAQSEGFGVLRGEIVFDPGSFEKSASDRDWSVHDLEALSAEIGSSKQPRGAGPGLTTKDFVIIDDLIVDGSACIGFDCVNGESFGFDTIRVKENNLRIKFDDTSTAASFPRNDWQLTANDSANGGASKFSIDDISGNRTPFTVEANARSHSLYVDDGGRIGSRTSTPSVEIHTIDGDTPTLRLQQDGSSGFAPQTWDVAGNETNFFVRDVTNGSTLPFRIRPGAPSSAIFIDVSGDVGIGTSSPAKDFHVQRTSGTAELSLETTDSQAVQFNMINGGGQWQFIHGAAGAFNFNRVGVAGNQFVFSTNGSLTIQGSLVAQGGDGTTDPGDTFPEYVFEPEYELMPMSDLAEYVSLNKHLPGVISRDDVRSTGGINMTKLQMQMLEKIEELTLYTLQQHDVIHSQNARIEQLQKRLDALEESPETP